MGTVVGPSAKEEVIDLIQELVQRESPSLSISGTGKIVDFVEDYFRGAGIEIFRKPVDGFADCLTADVGTGEEQILLLCHLDTVWPLGEVSKRPATVIHNRMTGPGVADMKSGVAMVMWLLRALRQRNAQPATRVRVLFNTDEEVGTHGSREIVETEAARSIAVLVFEPGFDDGSVKTRRKGWGHFDIQVHGVSAHAGSDHVKGRNAIRALAKIIERLESMTDYSKEVTVNVGFVQGGRQRNSVPDFACAEVDLRVPDEESAARMTTAIRNLAGSKDDIRVKVAGGMNRPPFERHEGVVALFEYVVGIATELGITLNEVSMGGVSDGNFSAALGIPTLDGLGPAGGGTHALDEYIDTESIVPRLQILERLVCNLTGADLTPYEKKSIASTQCRYE